MPHLQNDTPFPHLTLPRVGGGTLDLPGDLEGYYGVVLVYRGAWCPYCNAQLASFARSADAFDAEGVRVAALSVDDEATATELVERRGLSFPVGYAADADATAQLLGSYVNPEPHFLQSTGFVLAPDSRVITSVYSSGAIGRLVADDVLGLVRYVKRHG